MRYFADISYNGSRYHGWQIQNNAKTVQGVLNGALSTILRSDVTTIGSGRTDTGVHASMQMVHFDSESEFDLDEMKAKLNSLLPWDIVIKDLHKVKEEANARFDATSRAYIYKIHSKKNPFLEGLSYYFHTELDESRLNSSCELIKKWKDFEALSKVKTDVNNFDCDVMEAFWEKQNDALYFHVRANRFLRGMVRTLVGTMLEIGQKRMDNSDFEEILQSKDRRKAGRAVPAHGLYLRDITYPDHIYL